MKLSSILTILDKQKHDQVALKKAVQLRDLTGARLELVSFLWNTVYDNAELLDSGQRKALKQASIQQCKEWQAGLLSRTPIDKPKIDTRVVWSNNLAKWTSELQGEAIPDLVIKSVHGQKTLTHTPTDWQLLSTSPAPILLCSTQRRKRSKKQPPVVLAAVDVRHTSVKHRRLNARVLAAAAAFAELYEAQLHCVFAIEIPEVLRDLDILDVKLTKKRILSKCEPEMNRLLESFSIPKSRVHLKVGKVGQVVSGVARSLNAELLVVGSDSKRARSRLGLGTSAEKILARAATDLLVVHPHG